MEVSEGKKLYIRVEGRHQLDGGPEAKVEGGKAEIIIWSSEYRSMADALELRGDEGRDKLR